MLMFSSLNSLCFLGLTGSHMNLLQGTMSFLVRFLFLRKTESFIVTSIFLLITEFVKASAGPDWLLAYLAH